MELSQLRSFLQVAAEGSVTRAAEALFLTQPAVTQQIHNLEAELGMLLFERTGRGMRLTPAGEAFREYVRRSLALLDEARQVIGDLEQGISGRLVVGAGVTTSIFRLPGWLREFREQYPAVDVVVRTGRSREIAALALAREIDLGLVTSPVDHPDLRVTELFEEEIVLVGAHTEQSVDLTMTPLILFPQGTGFREYLDHVFLAAGIRPRVKMETDSVEAIKSFVTVGLGLSFLPLSAVETEIASGSLRRCQIDALPPLTRRTAVIYRHDRYRSIAARAFLRIVGNEAGEQETQRAMV